MEYLKEDGSLDVERINSLPIEEYMAVMGDLTKEQVEDYFSKSPLNTSHEPIKPIEIESTFDVGVDADKFLKSLDERYGVSKDNELGEEKYADENPDIDIEDMLLVTIRQLDNPEVVLWARIPKMEWQDALTLRDKFTLFERWTFGQSTEETIKEIEEICNSRSAYTIGELKKIQKQIDEGIPGVDTERYVMLQSRLEKIRNDFKPVIQSHIEHKNKIVNRLEELSNNGLLEIIEEPAGEKERMTPWDFIEKKNLLIGIK